MAICSRTNCERICKANWCGRHWAMLSEELRTKFRRSAKDKVGRHLLTIEANAYLDARLVGPHEVMTCRGTSCRQRLIWLPNAHGTNVAVHAETVEPEDRELDESKHTSHRNLCPNRDEFRRRLHPARGARR